MKKAIVALLFISAVIVAVIIITSGSEETKMGSDVLVRVNGEPIRTSDVQWSWSMLPADEKKKYMGPNGFSELLNELIVWKLMAMKAEKKGLDEEPQVKRRVENFRQNLLVNALINQTITEEEVFNYFQNHYMHAVFIMVQYLEDASDSEIEKARKLAQKIHAELADSGEFKKAGEKYASEYENVKTGDMGYLTKEDVAEQAGQAVAEVLFGLENPGEISEPVKSREGYFIFMALEPPQNLNPRGMSSELRTRLRNMKREEIIRSYANEFKTSEVKVQKNEKAIQDLLETFKSQWEGSGQKREMPAPATGSTAGKPLDSVREVVGGTQQEEDTSP
ncbi:MAG: peptidylprolyl isomerase [bacterium]